MGVVTFTIGGTNVLSYLQVGSLSCDHYINQRPVLRFRLRVRDGDNYRPDVREEVEFTDDSEVMFGGIVFNVTETDVVNYKHRDLSVDAVGYEVFADVSMFNGVVASATLEAQLTEVVAALSSHGITVDSSMATGPSMDAQAIPYNTARGALDQLAKASGWNWKFDMSKQVLMEDPGTVPAPFSLTTANSTILSLSHTKSLANYVNDAWVKYGGSEQRDVTDSFLGDGSTDTFVLNYPVAVAPITVTEDGVTFSFGGVGGWTYSATPTPRIIKSSSPANGDAITVSFTAQFPAYTFVRDDTEVGLYDPWTAFFEYPDIFEVSQAQAAASWELARRVGVVRRMTATTATPGLWPGMTVDVTASKRDLSSTEFLIQRVGIRHQIKKRDGEHLFFYEAEGLEGNQYQQNWQEVVRNINRAGGGGAGAAGGVSSGGGSTAVTVRGAFWGGSRQFGWQTGSWEDVVNWLPVSIDGTAGVPVTVRVDQRTEDGGTSVQSRIVKIGGSTMVTGTLSTSTSWTERLLTFTPDSGTNDYKLQVQGGGTGAQVFAIGQSL